MPHTCMHKFRLWSPVCRSVCLPKTMEFNRLAIGQSKSCTMCSSNLRLTQPGRQVIISLSSVTLLQTGTYYRKLRVNYFHSFAKFMNKNSQLSCLRVFYASIITNFTSYLCDTVIFQFSTAYLVCKKFQQSVNISGCPHFFFLSAPLLP